MTNEQEQYARVCAIIEGTEGTCYLHNFKVDEDNLDADFTTTKADASSLPLGLAFLICKVMTEVELIKGNKVWIEETDDRPDVSVRTTSSIPGAGASLVSEFDL